jgi:pimeloyl-ACP methyl ester carboxylesterase
MKIQQGAVKMKKSTNFTQRNKPLRAVFARIILAAAFLLMAGCGGRGTAPLSVPAGAAAGDLLGLEPCTYKAGKVEYAADCGTLVVPENRVDPGSRLIALPVRRVLSLNENPAEPIFWFAGGPGSTNMDFSNLEDLLDRHDIVMVGYRGVDGSTVLNCPEAVQATRGSVGDLLAQESIREIGSAFTRCFTRLASEGVDLDGYNIPEVVEDNEAARVALGYSRVNLLSGSYGTRVAQMYAWMYPQSVFRSAMISVNPPGHMVWEPDVLDSQIEYDARLCAQDPACSARTPDLAASVQSVAASMPKRWLFFPIDEGKVRFVTHFLLWHRGTAATAYDIYLSAERGDPSGLAILSLMYDVMIPSMSVWGDLAIKAASADFDPGRDYLTEMRPPGSIMGAPMSEFAWGSVQTMDWTIKSIPEELRRVQPSDVEMLLVSGSIDATTPAQWATTELMPSLSNGQQVILSEFGHTNDVWKLQPEALRHLLVTFYETGDADDSLFVYQPMDFHVGLMSFPLLAKVLLAVVVLLLLLVAFLVWFFVRRAKRRKAESVIHR